MRRNMYVRIIPVLVSLILFIAGCDIKRDAPVEKSEGVMSYAEYTAAPFDSEVVVEAYVQATEIWVDNNIRVYTQDQDGAYYIYSMECTESDASKLTPGTRIRVTGRKSVWAGQVEIVDATFTILDGKYIAEATDVTELLASEELKNIQNSKALIKNVRISDAGNGQAYLYGEDGKGIPGDDIYIKGDVDGELFDFKVESNLCPIDSNVYTDVSELKIDDVVDMEVILVWNEKVIPYVTSVNKTGD